MSQSERNEKCKACGSMVFAVARDMTSQRRCKCGFVWDCPPKIDKDAKIERLEKAVKYAQENTWMMAAPYAHEFTQELQDILDGKS